MAEVRILGPPELLGDDGSLVPLAGKERRLLVALAAAPGRTRDPELLIDAIWGEQRPQHATKVLQVYVSRLRKVLPHGIAVRTGISGYALDLAVEDSLDSAKFQRLVADARAAFTGGDGLLAASLLDRGLSLWRGRAFGEMADDHFVRAEAERLEELRLLAIEEQVDAQLRAGEHATCIAELQQLAGEHPLRERLQAQLMTALYRGERQTEALDLYASFRRRLRDELGLEPGPLLRELQQRILKHDPELLVPASGEQRWVSLPSPPGRLIGRERELRELEQLLEREEVRLVVLTGAGGSGKTRLAVEIAHRMAPSFANGSALIELGPLRDPGLVLPTIMAGLRLREQDGEPLQALVNALRPRELLLVLDNAEHLPTAAPLYSELLAQLPRLTLVITSRSVLHLSGEHVYPVEPLNTDAAVDLFNQRAGEADARLRPNHSETSTIAGICDRVDRLPLAVEIAAGRMRTLSATELLDRLDKRLPLLTGGSHDLPARQQTLRATIEWSFDLLNGDSQRDFSRLAIFARGCTIDAAETVCDTPIERIAVLVDQHLLRRSTTVSGSRLEMLETIQEYATERLEQSGEASELRKRHAQHYLVLAEEAAPSVERGNPQEWLSRLADERDNLRRAFETLDRAGDTQSLLRLAGALWPLWMIAGQVREARHWLEHALGADARPTTARARALSAGAQLAAVGGPFSRTGLDTARRRAEEAAQIYMLAGDRSGAALARWALGSIASRQGQWTAAREQFTAAAQEFRELGDEHFVLVAETHSAFAYDHLGDHARAREIHEGNLERARQLGNKRVEALILGALAMHAVDDGRLDAAWVMLEDAYRIHCEFEFLAFLGLDLIRFAAILVRRSNAFVAVQLVARADRLRDELAGDREDGAVERSQTIALAREQLDEADFAEACGRGRGLTLEEAFALATETQISASRLRVQQPQRPPSHTPRL